MPLTLPLSHGGERGKSGMRCRGYEYQLQGHWILDY